MLPKNRTMVFMLVLLLLAGFSYMAGYYLPCTVEPLTPNSTSIDKWIKETIPTVTSAQANKIVNGTQYIDSSQNRISTDGFYKKGIHTVGDLVNVFSNKLLTNDDITTICNNAGLNLVETGQLLNTLRSEEKKFEGAIAAENNAAIAAATPAPTPTPTNDADMTPPPTT